MSHSKGTATIISPEPLDEEALASAIADTGYEVKAWRPSPTKSTAFSSEKIKDGSVGAVLLACVERGFSTHR